MRTSIKTSTTVLLERILEEEIKKIQLSSAPKPILCVEPCQDDEICECRNGTNPYYAERAMKRAQKILKEKNLRTHVENRTKSGVVQDTVLSACFDKAVKK